VGKEGSGGIVRHLLGNLDDESEGNSIKKSVIFSILNEVSTKITCSCQKDPVRNQT